MIKAKWGKAIMNYKHGFFQLDGREDGTYIRFYPPKEGGNKIITEDVCAYMDAKKMEIDDLKELNQVILNLDTKKVTEYKVNNVKILPEDEFVKVTITKDRKMAVVRFYPPCIGGKLMTKSDIMDELDRSRVKFGINETILDAYLKARQFCINIVIARAKEPIQGKDATITYNFKTVTNAKPRILEDGSVDFHQLDNINHVDKGDILAVLEPADYGTSGVDVCGGELLPIKVNNAVLKHGRNIHLSEDKRTMYADVSGHVTIADNTVFVSNMYEVGADVDSSTGDIEYDGNVNINGNVRTGFKVEATGNIYVKGVVEGATLIAGGDIVLNRGIQGMGRGVLEAEGNIISKFIESSTVTAGGDINTDAIMHSVVTAKGNVMVEGKKGLITGGEIKAATKISMKTAGSTMGTHTILQVGFAPELVEEYNRLEKAIPGIEKNLDQVKILLVSLIKKLQQDGKLSPEKLKMMKEENEKKVTLEKELEEKTTRFKELEEEMNHNESGRIRIENVAYPGVKILISNAPYIVRNEVHHAQLIKERSEVRILTI